MGNFFQAVRIFFENVNWRDALDVLIVAVILYFVLKLIRGTQAVQLLLGLAVLGLIGFTAHSLQLKLLDFIFTNGSQAIVLAIIVLFQPELRRALDQVGRLGRLREVIGHHAEVAIQHVVDETIRAANSLSERRTGALVVFERETGLADVAATGVRINGEVTAEVLATIFYPGSPLHDGAVIVRDDRIVAAGCVLPLAETLPGMGRLGTRHRAAVGLTLRSDAVVLVVSEETGLISLAHGQGKIIRGLDQAQLHATLMTVLGGTPVVGRMPIPRALFRVGAARAASRGGR